jgi:hypothetical protein
MAKDNFDTILRAAGSGKTFPALGIVKADAGMVALMSKMVPSKRPSFYGKDGNRAPEPPDLGQMRQTADRIAQNTSDTQTIMQMLPDTELSAQILISSILAPKDLETTELTFTGPEGIVPPDVAAGVTAALKLFFEQDYKIKAELPKILRDVLFDTGSYAEAIIPENAIDEVINGEQHLSLESLGMEFTREGHIRNKGLLGPVFNSTPTPVQRRSALALESLSYKRDPGTIDSNVTLEAVFGKPVETGITVTDNYNVLKIPKIQDRVRGQQVASRIGSPAMESLHGMTDRKLSSLIYKPGNTHYKPIVSLKTQEQLQRKTVGNPLLLHLPSESVLPVYVPGSPENHVGYYVLLDPEGHPLNKTKDIDYYTQLGNRMNSTGSFSSALLTKMRTDMGGFDFRNSDHLDYSVRAYGEMIEQDFLARLRNGVYGNGVALAKREEFYRIMFARTLSQQNTQVLFVPVELMTYFALRYADDGTGRSLMDGMKILNSIRCILTFANTMTALKNSIGRTAVNLKLDEDDPDPQKTIERMIHEFLRTREQSLPIGMSNPSDIADWMGRAGFEFTFEGHPGLPDVKMDISEKSSAYPKVDTDLEELYRKRAIMSVGLSPDSVDATFQPEFATSVVANNLLLAKRVVQIQDEFTPILNKHLRKIAMNSEHIVKKIKDILTDNIDAIVARAKRKGELEDKDYSGDENQAAREYVIHRLLHEFIENFEVSLPKPNSVTLENQLTGLQKYSEALDAVLPSYISTDFLNSDTIGDLSNHVDAIRGVVKAYYIRKYLSENGMLLELNELITNDEEGKPVVNIYNETANHVNSLMASLSYWMDSVQITKQAANKAEHARTETDGGEGGAEVTTTDTTGGGTTGSDTGNDNDDFGNDFGDDFGDMGNDLGGDEGGGPNDGLGGTTGPASSGENETPEKTPEASANTEKPTPEKEEEGEPEDKGNTEEKPKP